MRNFYIYKHIYKVRTKLVSSTVIFCDNTVIDKNKLVDEIGRFYQKHSQTDKIFVIGGNYLKDDIKRIFDDEKEDTFKKIPKRQETSLYDNIYLLVFNKVGDLTSIDKSKKIPSSFLESFLNAGLQNIFISRGGLVETEGTHHYVFPSGKHCDKFLRTGNILLYSCEINFIAFSLLKYLDEKKHDQIYCDSSSINSIAISLSSLKNRFLSKKKSVQIPVESFSSYKGLYDNKLNYKDNALLIISASTSGNILDYINSKHKEINRANIVVLFYLDIKGSYTDIKDNVLCNLTKSKSNPIGIQPYKSYKEDDCGFCANGSYPVEVSGDVFLLEKPKINPVLIGITDANKKLSPFVEQFKSIDKKHTILKANYKEESQSSNKYDLYIDYSEILHGIKEDSSRYSRYRIKLDAYINQYVPSNTRYLIHLNDNSSKDLALYVLDKIKENYKSVAMPKIISQDDLSEVPKKENGNVLIVASCISNGKNLLYLSRALRNYRGLRVVYFVGITRVNNPDAHKELKSNLKQGNYGPETSTFIEVESIYCANISKNNNWTQEISFLDEMIDLLGDENVYQDSLLYFKERKKVILQSYSIQTRGLSDNLFFPVLNNKLEKILEIRNNFAFFNFEGYVNHVTQSDIYFTFNNVINSLRNSDNIDKSLKQTSFVRNLLSPNNFNRFNDGIIQASILRSAFPSELSYSIDFDLSLEMKGILETLIKYIDDDQSEALLEFLYAIAIGKLSLKKEHILEVLEILKKEKKHEIINCFVLFIEKVLIKKFYR